MTRIHPISENTADSSRWGTGLVVAGGLFRTHGERPIVSSVLALDIGGTRITAAEFDGSGSPGDVREFATDTIGSVDELWSAVKSVPENPVDAVGVAAAGVVDRETNTLENVVNWAGWDLTPLERRFGAPLVVENDADASALGLLAFGDIDPSENFAYLTISTGIGAGVVQRGDLIPGVEAGFANINWDGSVHHSGVQNPWEAYAAGGAINGRVSDWLDTETRATILTGQESAAAFFEAVYEGDEVARDYYTRIKRANAAGIGTVTDLFSLDRCKVGGGVVRNNPMLIEYDSDPYATEDIDLEEYCVQTPPRVETVELDGKLELFGAAAAARDEI